MAVLVFVLILSIVVEAITTILRKAEPIQPLVQFFTVRFNFLERLFSCGYCLSFWVSLGCISVYHILVSNPVILVETDTARTALNFIVMLLISHRFSNIIHGSIDKYFDRHYDKRYRSFFDELE